LDRQYAKTCIPTPEVPLTEQRPRSVARRGQRTTLNFHRLTRKVSMPDRTAIRHTLIEFLEADTGERFSDLQDDTNLREGLGLDSVDVVSIVSQIERRFHIRLTHTELETLVTVSDVLTLLESKLSAAELNPPVPSPSTQAA
jgi:acyl carrier protein